MLKKIVGDLLILIAILIATALCSYRPLPPRDNIGTTHRLPAVTATPLAQRITALQAGHPDASGHYPLADGRAAFAARLALINSAQRSLDLQYYLWHDDNADRLLAAALYRAAARGVRVRLLLDDNNTRSLDPLLPTLDAHPNISVRLSTPSCSAAGASSATSATSPA